MILRQQKYRTEKEKKKIVNKKFGIVNKKVEPFDAPKRKSLLTHSENFDVTSAQDASWQMLVPTLQMLSTNSLKNLSGNE